MSLTPRSNSGKELTPVRKSTSNKKRTKAIRHAGRKKVRPDLRLKNYLIEPHPDL